jgi:radical SAM protein with 4Fe4S-binding SPASM domain
MKYSDIADIADGQTLNYFSFYSFIPKGTRICIFGSGGASDLLYEFIKNNRTDIVLDCFVDRFASGEKHGLPIIRPEAIKERENIELIVICSSAHNELSGVLRSLQLNNFVIYSSSGGRENLFHTQYDLTAYSKNHFTRNTNKEQSMLLFKNSVKTFIFETTNYCNRNCDYCPVSMEPSRKQIKGMSDEVFNRIVRDLKEIDYSNWICLNLFNEPLADKPSLYNRLQTLGREVPNGRLFFHTNGDYFDRDTLEKLYALGVKVVSISIHFAKEEPYSDVSALNKINKAYERLGLSYKYFHMEAGVHINSEAFFNGMRINAFSTNYRTNGVNRGELLPDIPSPANRVTPCLKPFALFAMSYDGTIYPCCHLFPDSDVHKKKYSCGHVFDYEDIFDAYTSKLFTTWRRILFLHGEKHHPCSTCNDNNFPCSSVEINLRKRYMQMFQANSAAANE